MSRTCVFELLIRRGLEEMMCIEWIIIPMFFELRSYFTIAF
jgi:hypothetical protein